MADKHTTGTPIPDGNQILVGDVEHAQPDLPAWMAGGHTESECEPAPAPEEEPV